MATRKPQYTHPPTLLPALAGLFSSPENARAVGLGYLRAYPERSDSRLLLTDLGLEAAGRYDAPSLRKHLQNRAQRDFIVGDTLIINRWILSRTEASVCALVTLS